jgi:hypothetical protein
MERFSRRNLLKIGAASAAVVAVPVAAVAARVSSGNDAALLAMIVEVDELNGRINDLRHQTYCIVRDLLPERSFSDEEFVEARAIARPHIEPLESEADGLEERALALEVRIKEAKAQTLKGAVARAALFVGDEDWEVRLLADLREIVARGGRL